MLLLLSSFWSTFQAQGLAGWLFQEDPLLGTHFSCAPCSPPVAARAPAAAGPDCRASPDSRPRHPSSSTAPTSPGLRGTASPTPRCRPFHYLWQVPFSLRHSERATVVCVVWQGEGLPREWVMVMVLVVMVMAMIVTATVTVIDGD